MKSKEEILASYDRANPRNEGLRITAVDLSFGQLFPLVFKIVLAAALAQLIIGAVLGIPVYLIYQSVR